jgi:hypothetical protein
LSACQDGKPSLISLLKWLIFLASILWADQIVFVESFLEFYGFFGFYKRVFLEGAWMGRGGGMKGLEGAG